MFLRLHRMIFLGFLTFLLNLHTNGTIHSPKITLLRRNFGFTSPHNQSKFSLRRTRQPSQTHDVPPSPCHVNSKDVHCLPAFQNIVRGRLVQATSTCGLAKVQRLCLSDGTCHLCDAKSSKWRFPPGHLTDAHNSNNYTCWASSMVRAGGPEQAVNLSVSLGKRFEVDYISLQPCTTGALPDSIAIYKSSDFGRTWRPWHYFSTDCFRAFGLPTTHEYNTHITTANLQEVICVGLESRDAFSSKNYRKRRSSLTAQKNVKQNSSATEFGDFDTTLDSVISFSTTLGRPAKQPWSPALIDWMTMTDIRISMMRFPTNTNFDYRAKRTVDNYHFDFSHRPKTNQLPYFRFHEQHQSYGPQMLKDESYFQPYAYYDTRRSSYRHLRSSTAQYDDLQMPPLSTIQGPNNTMSIHDNPLHSVEQIPLSEPQLLIPTEPDVLSDAEFFAFSDLTIGGRCKCNGHASECVMDSVGRLKCICEHNTDGNDCERCKQGFMDRPWERATLDNAKSCTQCDCNLHSTECRFSNSLYLMSNRVSGGVCENCQHNTAGRNCQHCAEGFYRDWTKPISHEYACLPCRCHPIGSIIRHDCDRRSGQCRCKQGVTGTTCDRCQDGYHQTRSPTNPCTKDYSPQPMALAHTPAGIHCTPCNSNKERIRLKKFCRKDAVLQATFKSRELHGPMARFEMHVNQVWRLKIDKLRGSTGLFWPGKTSYEPTVVTTALTDYHVLDEKPEELIPVWVHVNELRCKCPEIQLGISYLIVTDLEQYTHNGKLEVRFTPKTALLPWRESWARRLMRFHRRQSRGICDRFNDPPKLSHENLVDKTRTNPNWYASYASRPYYHSNPKVPVQTLSQGLNYNAQYAHRRKWPFHL